MECENKIKQFKKMNVQLVQDVKNKFLKTFKSEPLLIFSPGRINLIGEHTDYNGGFVFPQL